MRGTNSARRAASSRAHGVVRVSSTTSEIDVATRITIRPAAVSPCWVRPTSLPNHVPRGTTTSPGVMKLKVAGSTTMPVKIGMNSHTRLTKNPSGRPDATARTSVASVATDQHGQVAHEGHADQQAEDRHQLHPGVESLQQAGLVGRRPRRTSPGAAGRRRRRSSSHEAAFLRLPMHPHGHSPTSGRSSQSGMAVASLMSAPRPSEVARDRRRPHLADDEDRAEHRNGDDGDADHRRDHVAERRMLVVAEAVPVEEGVVPEAGVVPQPGRDGVEVVLPEVQVVG